MIVTFRKRSTEPGLCVYSLIPKRRLIYFFKLSAFLLYRMPANILNIDLIMRASRLLLVPFLFLVATSPLLQQSHR